LLQIDDGQGRGAWAPLNCGDDGRAVAIGTWLMANSLMAVIVSDRFTPGFAGTVDPSQISMFR
jgi:hypothetical protein